MAVWARGDEDGVVSGCLVLLPPRAPPGGFRPSTENQCRPSPTALLLPTPSALPLTLPVLPGERPPIEAPYCSRTAADLPYRSPTVLLPQTPATPLTLPVLPGERRPPADPPYRSPTVVVLLLKPSAVAPLVLLPGRPGVSLPPRVAATPAAGALRRPGASPWAVVEAAAGVPRRLEVPPRAYFNDPRVACRVSWAGMGRAWPRVQVGQSGGGVVRAVSWLIASCPLDNSWLGTTTSCGRNLPGLP